MREALNSGMSVAESLNVLWDEDTKAIFAAIISFWFGSRAIDKRGANNDRRKPFHETDGLCASVSRMKIIKDALSEELISFCYVRELVIFL